MRNISERLSKKYIKKYCYSFGRGGKGEENKHTYRLINSTH